MRNFKVLNISCENCANTIKNVLRDEFGEVKVDVKSGIVSLNLSDENTDKFYEEIEDIGFEVVEEVK
ncbi:MAG: heavy metal transport/detoxification protein [Campylobacter sp.]|nr:heavy metal transport/detoxification protein [Campylobacter sp.]